MPNKDGDAYGLTTLCPIVNGSDNNRSYADRTRDMLQHRPLNEASPMAKEPNTYLCRMFVRANIAILAKIGVHCH
jgi:hypothetical protein